MKKRKELLAWAKDIGSSIDKSIKEREEKDWQFDIASFDRRQKMLVLIKTQSIRDRLIKEMTEIKDKYPQHLKNVVIPQA